ncbi:MAG: DUF4139 domain-containing protein [Acidimicrobiia bacterium]|nr:DUF4139 domain-containing protein [Acidimicrobiia bacterium]
MTARRSTLALAAATAMAMAASITPAVPAARDLLALPVEAAPPDDAPLDSTLDDQTELAMTVYNSDLALIRDRRKVRLGKGAFDLRFQDIAATVNPATVHFRSLTETGRVKVLEQNYEYDLLEPDKLLRKYVGRDVTLVLRAANGTTPEETVSARLLSYNGAPVWRIGDEIVTGLHADHMRFPQLPANLFARPTLIWTLQNTGTVLHQIEASYLATKLAWKADYVLTVGRDEAADIDGWVTLTNNSGTSFRNASLQLVAGELNRVRQMLGDMRAEADSCADAQMVDAAMAQEAFSDYHLYTLGRKTTINNRETKQVSMLGATGFPIRKRYVVDGRAFYYRNAQHPGSPVKDDVQVFYEWKNEERAGLGMPMPSGTVRVYQADSKGGVQCVGEDNIRHTPKDETLKVKIGHAFDVVAERKQTGFRKVGDSTYEIEVGVTLRNHEAVPVTVEVNEPIGGTWRMVRSSHRWTKTDAWASHFEVPVAVDVEAMLTYRVRVTY